VQIQDYIMFQRVNATRVMGKSVKGRTKKERMFPLDLCILPNTRLIRNG